MSRADSPLKDRMIFCFGARRSGTYLLQRIVAAHPAVSQVPSETHLFSHGIKPLFERFQHESSESLEVGSMYADRDRLLDSARDFCDGVLAPYLEDGTERVVERTPLHALHADLIADIYPDARFVHIVRDGRDVARSIASQDWGPDTIAGAAEEWRDTVEGGRALWGNPRYIELRYESLLESPRQSVERLYADLELDASDSDVDAGVAALGEKVNLGPGETDVGTGKWREAFSPEDERDFERVAGDLERGLGYVGGETLRDRVESIDWYHTLELAPGVESPGYYDLRGIVSKMPVPESLEGKRCLDIGTFDGFWAFEMERRGASEVIGIDILDPRGWDWPANSTSEAIQAIARRKGRGEGFEIAREAFGSKVERRELSVLDLDPAEVGEFDFVYLGSLLLHLRDPVAALEAIRGVCRGSMVVCDGIDLAGSRRFRHRPVAELDAVGRPWWWKPNVAALVTMVEAGGFEPLGEPVRLYLPPGAGHPPRRYKARWLLQKRTRIELLRPWLGDPHAALAARPAEIPV